MPEDTPTSTATAIPKNDGEAVSPNIPLRDWFALSAPQTPLWTFEVRMPSPRPECVMVGEGSNRDCANEEEVAEWDRERRRQEYIQWPWVYADAMLDERSAK